MFGGVTVCTYTHIAKLVKLISAARTCLPLRKLKIMQILGPLPGRGLGSCHQIIVFSTDLIWDVVTEQSAILKRPLIFWGLQQSSIAPFFRHFAILSGPGPADIKNKIKKQNQSKNLSNESMNLALVQMIAQSLHCWKSCLSAICSTISLLPKRYSSRQADTCFFKRCQMNILAACLG